MAKKRKKPVKRKSVIKHTFAGGGQFVRKKKAKKVNKKYKKRRKK